MSSLHPSINNWVVTAQKFDLLLQCVKLLAEEKKPFITVTRLELQMSDFIPVLSPSVSSLLMSLR